MPETFLNVLTTADITDVEMGEAIARRLLESAPECFPDRIGNWEPIKNACKDPEDIILYWQWPVLGKCSRPKTAFSVWFRKPHRKYSTIYLSTESRCLRQEAGSELLAYWATLTKAEFGMIQHLSPAYLARAEQKNLVSFTDRKKKGGYIHLHDENLVSGVPDAFDVMWLPNEHWNVTSTKLLEPSAGLFTLPLGEDSAREEIRGQIQKKG